MPTDMRTFCCGACRASWHVWPGQPIEKKCFNCGSSKVIEALTPTEANYSEVLPDPPMVDFGAAIWRYRQESDAHILVETEAVERLIRAALTDDALRGIYNDAIEARDAAYRDA
ncbi:MAG: hypothetical protein IH912_10420, partial [Proteobacteria bacterium]|nr:hypothetical protein [Pseudomonadota bacterium]